MIVIGITGGVGAGKSQILDWLKQRWKVPFIRTDDTAKKLMEPGQEGYRQVIQVFGKSIVNPDESICRPALAKLIFQNEEARNQVNQITHPLVWNRVKEELEDLASQGCRAAAVESAVFDTSGAALCGQIWYVYAPEEVRIQKKKKDRGYSQERCLSMIYSQNTDQQFRDISSQIIDNGGSWEQTKKQLDQMMQNILA